MMILGMTYLVKDEVDIIEENIRYHSNVGVDNFVVIDNGSTDGTLEKLESLKNEFKLTLIHRPVVDYQQSNWRTEMSKISRKKYGSQWVIANDADEFYVCSSNNLKDHLSFFGSVISCDRFNVLYTEDDFNAEAKFYDQQYRVNYPIFYPKGIQTSWDKMSINLGCINGKVLVRTLGLLRQKGGNHRAWHLWGKINAKHSDDIKVYHFPIRSKAHFISHLERRKDLLNAGVTKMGDHYRRWVAMMDKGELDSELKRLALDDEYLRVLLDLGVVIDDSNAIQTIKKFSTMKPNT